MKYIVPILALMVSGCSLTFQGEAPTTSAPEANLTEASPLLSAQSSFDVEVVNLGACDNGMCGAENQTTLDLEGAQISSSLYTEEEGVQQDSAEAQDDTHSTFLACVQDRMDDLIQAEENLNENLGRRVMVLKPNPQVFADNQCGNPPQSFRVMVTGTAGSVSKRKLITIHPKPNFSVSNPGDGARFNQAGGVGTLTPFKLEYFKDNTWIESSISPQVLRSMVRADGRIVFPVFPEADERAFYSSAGTRVYFKDELGNIHMRAMLISTDKDTRPLSIEVVGTLETEERLFYNAGEVVQFTVDGGTPTRNQQVNDLVVADTYTYDTIRLAEGAPYLPPPMTSLRCKPVDGYARNSCQFIPILPGDYKIEVFDGDTSITKTVKVAPGILDTKVSNFTLNLGPIAYNMGWDTHGVFHIKKYNRSYGSLYGRKNIILKDNEQPVSLSRYYDKDGYFRLVLILQDRVTKELGTIEYHERGNFGERIRITPMGELGAFKNLELKNPRALNMIHNQERLLLMDVYSNQYSSKNYALYSLRRVHGVIGAGAWQVNGIRQFPGHGMVVPEGPTTNYFYFATQLYGTAYKFKVHRVGFGNEGQFICHSSQRLHSNSWGSGTPPSLKVVNKPQQKVALETTLGLPIASELIWEGCPAPFGY